MTSKNYTVFTDTEAQTIMDVRALLKEVEDHVTDMYIRKQFPVDVDGFDCGKVSEAIDAAQDALFNVLNTACHYMKDRASDRAIHAA